MRHREFYTSYNGCRVPKPLLDNLLMSIKAYEEGIITERCLGIYDEIEYVSRPIKHAVFIDFERACVRYEVYDTGDIVNIETTIDPDGEERTMKIITHGDVHLEGYMEYIRSELDDPDVHLDILRFTEECLDNGV